MIGTLVLQTLTFRASVVLIDYVILALVMQRPLEAGLVTAIRHLLGTVFYWGHELVWLKWRLGEPVPTLAASRWHTLAKAISFRLVSVAMDLILLWIFTRDWRISSVAALLVSISNTAFFYYHDRWWESWRARHISSD